MCAGLIVAALFPYISASDDVLRLEHFIEQQKQGTSPTSQSNELMRLYQALDSPVIASARQTTLTLLFVMLAGPLVVPLIERSLPSKCGRAPPAAF